MDKPDVKLLPCPFCGQNNIIEQVTEMMIYCDDCGGTYQDTMEICFDTIRDMWNTRTPTEQTEPCPDPCTEMAVKGCGDCEQTEEGSCPECDGTLGVRFPNKPCFRCGSKAEQTEADKYLDKKVMDMKSVKMKQSEISLCDSCKAEQPCGYKPIGIMTSCFKYNWAEKGLIRTRTEQTVKTHYPYMSGPPQSNTEQTEPENVVNPSEGCMKKAEQLRFGR